MLLPSASSLRSRYLSTHHDDAFSHGLKPFRLITSKEWNMSNTGDVLSPTKTRVASRKSITPCFRLLGCLSAEYGPRMSTKCSRRGLRPALPRSLPNTSISTRLLFSRPCWYYCCSTPTPTPPINSVCGRRYHSSIIRRHRSASVSINWYPLVNGLHRPRKEAR